MTLRNNNQIQSDALRANLAATGSEVVVGPAFQPLQDVVADFQGLSAKLDHLLHEIHHPYRNWNFIIPELRAFVLKNLSHYLRHENGPKCFNLFCGIFLDALEDCQKNGKLVALVIEAMLAYTDKLINSINQDGLSSYGKEFNNFFSQLTVLDEIDSQVMMYMVQGHHPMKKMALKLVSFSDDDSHLTYNFEAIARLMQKILTLNYQYWLREEDPLPWFSEECGEFCEKWQANKSFTAISHEQLRHYRAELHSIHIVEGALAALRRIL